jgi:1-acyl-sn-glycerol-3-phosphate acyltransferase
MLYGYIAHHRHTFESQRRYVRRPPAFAGIEPYFLSRYFPARQRRARTVIKNICRVCESVYIDRRPEKAAETQQQLREVLSGGHVLCLFPEATTGDGLHMQPFKSGMFSLAQGDVTVQPVSLSYTHIRRLPIGKTQWPSIAWYGDMELAPHLWNFLKSGALNAELTFLPPATLQEHGDRKKLAAHCQALIAESIETVRNRRPAAAHAKQVPFQPGFKVGK